MRKLILTPEWRCTPIEIDYSDGCDDWFDLHGSVIEPEKLPLSQELIAEIWEWSEIYDTFLDWDDPASPKYIDPAIKANFWAKGEMLVKKIQQELGDEYSIKAGWNVSE